MTRGCTLIAIGALAVTSCGRVAPTSPSDSNSFAVTVPAPAAATGQVVSTRSTSGGISDVVISGVGAVDTRTDVRGFFNLSPIGSTYELLLAHPDFVDRRTTAILPAKGLHVSMIPATFDLPAFEELAPRSTMSGLRRWTHDPSLLALTNVVEYDGVYYQPRVTDRRLSDSDFACMLDGVQHAITPMSESALTFRKVDVESPPIGSRFAIGDVPEGTIVLAAAQGVAASGRAAPFVGSQINVFVRGVVWISADNLSLCGSTAARVYSHELGHALGYQHVMLEPSVMSGIQPTSAPTAFDRDGIRIIYQRPPGNRAPDIDPQTYVINATAQ